MMYSLQQSCLQLTDDLYGVIQGCLQLPVMIFIGYNSKLTDWHLQFTTVMFTVD